MGRRVSSGNLHLAGVLFCLIELLKSPLGRGQNHPDCSRDDSGVGLNAPQEEEN